MEPDPPERLRCLHDQCFSERCTGSPLREGGGGEIGKRGTEECVHEDRGVKKDGKSENILQPE